MSQPEPVRQPEPDREPEQPRPPVQQVEQPPAAEPPAAEPPAEQPAPDQRSAADGGDFFADLPRLRPFTDFELDPIPAAPAANGGSAGADAPDEQAPAPGITPRRPESGRAATGRHGRPDDADRTGGTGRRRRAADDEDNVLARILARELSSPE